MIPSRARWIVFILLLLSVTRSVGAEFPLELQPLGENIYALVGELDQRNPNNYANNATFGFIVTTEGVVLIDPGGSYRGAEQIAQAIGTVTDQPVTVVINSGGQDHRWLGNGYFNARGARIITSTAALADQQERVDEQLNRLTSLIGDALTGTEARFADETFDQKMKLRVGGVDFLLVHAGAAHTKGDLFVWLPAQRILFSGDIVYVERALGIGPAQDSASWLRVFEAMMAYQPLTIVPGHGHAATPEQARADTYDYLSYLRTAVGQVLDEGGDMQDATNIDQSRFSYLRVFDQIARRNAQAVYSQMEFE